MLQPNTSPTLQLRRALDTVLASTLNKATPEGPKFTDNLWVC